MSSKASCAPFYIDDLSLLREKLARAERDGTLMGRVWGSVRRRSRAAPGTFPWFAPFVALITGAEDDLEAARQAIRNYVATFDQLGFTMGLQFHFWCFAFPHARWALYFQWLDAIGAWDETERKYLSEKLVLFQFHNFFYGMRTKPEPQCVDNQTMSLCYSNALVGHLFGQSPTCSATAERMRVDGMRRLPDMIGGMPPGGYSGEGSTYMDYVVGPSVPLIIELLERSEGEDWFTRALPPNGGSAESIVRMIAREWMPNGLLLPWDHYGYALPVRSTIAYGAYRTGNPIYTDLLEHHADWSHEVSIGWGYDDLVWTLLWWPDERPTSTSRTAFPSWAAPDVGGALVSGDATLYLLQMWDHSTPKMPGRAHVNPNALALSAYGSPLTTDGVVARDCDAFNFEDTWHEVHNADSNMRRYNYGSGCAGAHGVLLVDGWEGMRAFGEYEQASLVEFDETGKSVTGDVTPIYRERYADARTIRRRSRLCGDRFWLIEDLARFEGEHDVSARWYFRPGVAVADGGVTVETAEGARLCLRPLLGAGEPRLRRIEGYPDRLDGASFQVDFTQRGSECRGLWLAWPEQTRRELADIADGWQAMDDPGRSLEYGQAAQGLQGSRTRLPFTQPAFMLSDQPLTSRWWYRKVIEAPIGPWWLRLPRGLRSACLWVNGQEIDLAPSHPLSNLMQPQVAMPTGLTGGVEIVVRCDCGVSQYGKDDEGGTGFWGRPAVLGYVEPAALVSAAYSDGVVSIVGAGREWKIVHSLMQ